MEILTKIQRCHYCKREMSCPPLEYEQNPFCKVCLPERIANEASRTTSCQVCNAPTSFVRKDISQPPEGEVCDQCGEWICPDCSPHCPPAPASRIEAEATARPWALTAIDGSIRNGITSFAVSPAIIATTHDYVADDNGREAEANAALIVQAVNSHQALVDALKDLVRQLPTDERLADYNLDRAEAALALAEGKGN